MFEKNLQDLVKGIRSAKGDVTVYISQCLQDIKTELKSTDPFLKSEAVRKLTYLHMLGYDMTWAAFHVVEVMSYERFAHKRVGYTAASQSFTQTTDVVLLCTNLLKKEFGSMHEYEVGLAINVLANIATTDLARDLLGDVVNMMHSPRAYVRKKATLVLFKMFLRYPQGLRLTFDELKERMEEPDVSVVSCAVNVICELANKKPKNYLGLAPLFFRLLTTSSNNWMLIKVVKLLASLVPEEPRLARKLLDPLATVIQNTPAKSLLYECIATVTTALLYTQKSDGSQPRNVPAVVRLCNDHLRRFIEDQDQNLRYLGLLGLSNLMESHPYVISEHRELIIECLAVDDITIRLRALDLLAGMVTPDNATQIIRELMRQTMSADGVYRQELITRILHVCSVNKYENTHDFDWYIHVLVQLARVPSNMSFARDDGGGSIVRQSKLLVTSSPNASGSTTASSANLRSHGVEVARQLVDIAVRVKSVRSVMVDNMITLLMEREAMSGPGASTLCEVFYAAAWIAGEYVTEYLDDSLDAEDEDDSDEEDDDERESEEEKLAHLEELVDEMLQPRTTSLPAHVQTVYMQALLKFVAAMADRAEDAAVDKMSELILERLSAFVQSEHIEVQERAVALQHVLLALGLGLGALSHEARAARAFDGGEGATVDSDTRLNILNGLFAERLAPVGAKAQRKVPLPGDLDLDEPFHAAEASFLESGGDVTSFANEDDLEVSFVPQFGGSSSSSAPYTGVGESSSTSKRGKKKKKAKKSKGGSDFYESASSAASSEDDSGDESETSKAVERERLQALEQERLRKDPFYLSGSKDMDATELGLRSGFADIMEALDASSKKSKKSKKHAAKKKKSKALLVEDDLMPDGANASDDDRRRSRKHRGGGAMEDDELAAVDLLVPLREDERMPDQHLYHRQVAEANAAEEPSKKVKKSKKKKSSHSSKSALNEEKSGKTTKDHHSRKSKDKPSSSTKTKSSKSKSSRKVEEEDDEETKENIYGSSDSERENGRHKRSHHKKKESGSSSKRASSSTVAPLKEKKSSSSKKKSHRHHKDKNTAAPQNEEPLLMF